MAQYKIQIYTFTISPVYCKNCSLQEAIDIYWEQVKQLYNPHQHYGGSILDDAGVLVWNDLKTK